MHIPVKNISGKTIHHLYSKASLTESATRSYHDEYSAYSGRIDLREEDDLIPATPAGHITFKLIQPGFCAEDDISAYLSQCKPAIRKMGNILNSYLKENAFDFSDFQCLFIITEIHLEQRYNTDPVRNAIIRFLLPILHTASPVATRYAVTGYTAWQTKFREAGWDVRYNNIFSSYVAIREISLNLSDEETRQNTELTLAWIRKNKSFHEAMHDIANDEEANETIPADMIHILTCMKDHKDELPPASTVNWQYITRVLKKDDV